MFYFARCMNEQHHITRCWRNSLNMMFIQLTR